MDRRAALHRIRRRAARGHPLWWVLAGIAVGVAGTAVALWRNADDDPDRHLGLRVPGYLDRLISGPPASAPAPAPTNAASRPRSD